jgi:hypothetical protein
LVAITLGVGAAVGSLDGALEGELDGRNEGTLLGDVDGSNDGAALTVGDIVVGEVVGKGVAAVRSPPPQAQQASPAVTLSSLIFSISAQRQKVILAE